MPRTCLTKFHIFSLTMTLLKQPLIQFLILGAGIFLLDSVMNSKTDDPRNILIDDAKYEEISGIYEDNQGKEPSEEEMADLMVKWSQNEVLYREARLMGLDKGDEMIRQRLILKMRNVLFGQLAIKPLNATQLQNWFNENRVRYDKPETFDFEQFKVGDKNADAVAMKLAETLGSSSPSDDQYQLRSYKGRPAENIQYIFGEDQTAKLLASTNEAWIPVSSPAGWHLARIVHRYPSEPANFDDIRTRVGEDWKKQAADTQLAEALRDIASKYKITIEAANPTKSLDGTQVNSKLVAAETRK